jgi:hypothetical protein
MRRGERRSACGDFHGKRSNQLLAVSDLLSWKAQVHLWSALLRLTLEVTRLTRVYPRQTTAKGKSLMAALFSENR